MEEYHPVTLYIDAEAQYADGAPTAEEIYATMESANYETFITDYVWMAGSPLFFETQRVYFSSSLDAGQIPGLPTPPGTDEPNEEITNAPTMALTASHTEAEVDGGLSDETTGSLLPLPPEEAVTDAPDVEMTELPEESEIPINNVTSVPASATSIPTTTDAEITGSTEEPMADSSASVTNAPGTAVPSNTTNEETGEVPDVEESQAPEDSMLPESTVTDVPGPATSTNDTSSGSASGEATSNPVVVPASLTFGFFLGVEVTEPTAGEIDGLVVQINSFYDDVLSAEYENFQTFETNGKPVERRYLHQQFVHQPLLTVHRSFLWMQRSCQHDILQW